MEGFLFRERREQEGELAIPAFSSWRGTLGLIKPTWRPGSLEELIRILPKGIGVIPLLCNIREGTEAEFRAALATYEQKASELAEAGVDIIHPAGAPPFMILGFEGERRLIDSWEQRFKTAVFTNGSNQVAALRALGVKRFVGASYFGEELNAMYRRYFEGAGFDVLTMEGIGVPFTKVQETSPFEIYRFVKALAVQHPEADGIYLLGSGWRTLEMIEMLEADLGLPVVQHIAAQSWEIQKRLRVHEPAAGLGRLLAEMP